MPIPEKRVFETLLRLSRFLERYVLLAPLGLSSAQLEATSFLTRALLQVASKLSWQGVRSLGNLQLLTKASYFSLLIVPMIAGMWPYIRNLVNEYNETVADAANNALNASKEIEIKLRALEVVGESPTLRSALLDAELTQISRKLDEVAQNFTYLLHETNMPASFALAFVASLAVAIGHLFYEAFCPQPVKDYDQPSYVSHKVREFKETHSEVDVSEACDYLDARLPSNSYSIHKMLKHETFDPNHILSNLYASENLGNSKNSTPASPEEGTSEEKVTFIEETFNSPANQKEALIDVASRVKYSEMSTDRLLAGFISLFLYSLGIVLLAVIVCRQFVNVLLAAGWLSS